MDKAPTDDAMLRDLVETRLEAPTTEYKRWMQLSDTETRAKIARHICALANSGGGYLVFGFEDDGTASEPHPADLNQYGQDAINGIVDRYLQPSVHCAVVNVAASSGRSYPVVRVPGHGAQPVCARRDGPQDDKGRPVGIQAGVHYIRVSGPKSVPIDSPERWRDVIHRCVVAEREGLLNSIGRLFDRPAAAASPPVLALWIDEALRDWPKVAQGEWAIDHVKNRAVFGFRLLTAAAEPPQPLSVSSLEQTIRTASFGASDEIGSGATPFEMTWSNEAKPNVALFGEVEGYEHRASTLAPHSIGELWRVAANGQGVSMQPFSEDSPWITQGVERRGSRKWPAGGKLSPKFQITFVAEHVAFVRRLAKDFPDAIDCELMVDYAGLAGRGVDEPAAGIYFSRSYKSAVDARRVSSRVSIDALAAGPSFRWHTNDHVFRAISKK